MTENVSHENMEPFKNPDLLPLENLKLEVRTGGVIKNVDALHKTWSNERYFLHYEAPNLYNDDGSQVDGSKAHWIEVVTYMIDDLRWLLNLPFYRFWSNIVFNTSIVDALVSFLQEAPPFYALENFPNCPEMLDLLETLRRDVLVVFTRLVTNKESPSQYMSQQYLGNLLYENYIFTVPIIFDLCQLYGRENTKIVERILGCLFALEPRYHDDLRKTVPCLVEALENVEMRFVCPSIEHTDGGMASLSRRNTDSAKLTLFNLEDMILYVLDIVSTINIFIKCYHAAVSIFHTQDFMNKIVSVYENAIPEMYKTLHKLAYSDEKMPKYMELKHRLDVTRIEIIHLFRTTMYEPLLNIQENSYAKKDTEIKEQVDEYLNLLTDAISEKEFITDYVQFYPVESDLKLLLNICPEIDPIKCDYILQSINATIGKPAITSTSFSSNENEAVAGPSGISRLSENTISSSEKQSSIIKNSVELTSLISEVKDILSDLDEQFIEMALEYYNHDTAAVIDAILEDSLPPKLKELKEVGFSQISTSPPSYQEAIGYDDLAHGFDEFNLVDTYEDVHVKIQEEIEIPKDYIIKNYSLVDDYEDEYDDTYDNHDIRGIMQDDATEVDSRPFTMPRVLREKQKEETIDEVESEDDDGEVEQNGRDYFVQNPEEIRAKYEQQRQASRSGGSSSNVIGKPRGQGQEKSVQQNRQHKNVQKAKRANHNRRAGARWKQSQGMIS